MTPNQDAATSRLVVGITGSSAPHYRIALLGSLRDLGSVETHLVVSDQGRENIKTSQTLSTTLAITPPPSPLVRSSRWAW